jgi:hypothetical protein
LDSLSLFVKLSASKGILDFTLQLQPLLDLRAYKTAAHKAFGFLET